MNREELFIRNVDEAVSSADDEARLAESLASVDISQTNGFAGNLQILADYISEFQFDWDNEVFRDKGEFASEAIAKVRQILADTKSGNQYKKIFSAELAYSRLEEGDYTYKVVSQKMSAKSVDDAVKEKDEIRAQASSRYPEDKNYALEDVRVKVKVVDQNENTVLEERFLLN